MDGRVQLPVIKFLQERFKVDHVDVITEAGPNLILSDGTNPVAIQSILDRLNISVRSHGSAGIAVVGHHDCAGNPSPQAQQTLQTRDAVELLKRRFTGVEIIGLWVDKEWKVHEIGEGNLELNRFISLMAHNAQRIRVLAEEISDEQARWKPDSKSWSILEVINHLLDEEREDFRVFLDYTLHRPGQTKPKISPEAWVTERKYNERNLGESLEGFLAAREESLTWLRGLSSPDWEVTYKAPWGPIRAGDVFAAWVAHDVLHMRQLVRLHWFYTTLEVGKYSSKYAGEW
jgi:hypothetical protein